MLNRQEILDGINKTKEHLANMEKMLEDKEWEEKTQRWKPKANEKYWYVTSTNHVAQTDFVMGDDFQRWLIYNCFKTEKEANQEAEKILIRRQLEDIARRLNKGKKIDWNDEEQTKSFLFFDSVTQLIERDCNIRNKIQGVVYCLDTDFRKIAIQKIGEDRLKEYLKG